MRTKFAENRCDAGFTDKSGWIKPGILGIVCGLVIAAVVFWTPRLMLKPSSARLTIIPEQSEAQLRVNGAEVSVMSGSAAFSLNPGDNAIEVVAPGYRPVVRKVAVLAGENKVLTQELEALPGYVTIVARDTRSSQLLEGVQVVLNGKQIGQTPLFSQSLEAGSYRLSAETGNDWVMTTGEKTFMSQGLGSAQIEEIELTPNNAYVAFLSDPPGATVIDEGRGGLVLGVTPIEGVKLPAASHEILMELDDQHSALKRSVVVQAGQDQVIEHIFVEKPGLLEISSSPAGARILVDGINKGVTPLRVQVEANGGEAVDITLTYEGYQPYSESVALVPGEIRSIEAELETEYGRVKITSNPERVPVYINGALVERPTPVEVMLQEGEHEITLEYPGMPPRTTKLEVLASAAASLHEDFIADVSGPPAKEELPDYPEEIVVGGIEMVLIQPGDLHFGAGKGKSALYSDKPVEVVISKPFYVSRTEVTNEEFSSISKTTRGVAKIDKFDLTLDDYPVVNVSWDEAASFCNELGSQSSLDSAYKEIAPGEFEQAPGDVSGFRLLTEAEFEYLLRYDHDADSAPYSWGAAAEPPAHFGNFADESAGKVGISPYLKKYDDASPYTSPAHGFKALGPGVYHLAGNASEWCHDTFSRRFRANLKPGSENPVCLQKGESRVVKGGSYRSGSKDSLLIAWRIGKLAGERSKDIGFRVALPAAAVFKMKR